MTKEKNPQKNVLIWKSGATVKTGKNDEKMKWVLVSRNIRLKKSDGKLIENNDNDETTPRWTSVDVGSIFSSNAQVSE